jgi:hypothetical protein
MLTEIAAVRSKNEFLEVPSSDKSSILANMKGVPGIKTAILFDNQM